MATQNKINQEVVSRHNRQLILQLLRRHGQLSRQQLADMTSLHRSTLSNIMREFIEADVVNTVGKRESTTVGKKQVLLEINPNRGWTLGVGITWDSASLTILNAGGKIVDRSSMRLGSDITLLPTRLKAHVTTWLNNLPTLKKLIGIGLAIPGYIDSKTGTILHSEYFNINNLDIAKQIQDVFDGVPVQVENDVRMSAMTEIHQNAKLVDSNILYFSCNYLPKDNSFRIAGFGSCLILNGIIYRGSHFGSGELCGILHPSDDQIISEHDLLLMETPDAELTEPLKELITWLSPQIIALTNFIDPELIILGGTLPWSNTKLIKLFEDTINREIFSMPGRKIILKASSIPNNASSFGAAYEALEQEIISNVLKEYI